MTPSLCWRPVHPQVHLTLPRFILRLELVPGMDLGESCEELFFLSTLTKSPKHAYLINALGRQTYNMAVPLLRILPEVKIGKDVCCWLPIYVLMISCSCAQNFFHYLFYSRTSSFSGFRRTKIRKFMKRSFWKTIDFQQFSMVRLISERRIKTYWSRRSRFQTKHCRVRHGLLPLRAFST